MGQVRAGFTLRLKPGGLEEYVRRHDEIWPELVAEMASKGVEQVTIFHSDSTLFIYSEIADADTWERLWNLDIHLRWAAELEPYLELAADGTPDSRDLTEIFHLEPGAHSADD
jgi:L-rhamnose mutarotase